MATGPGEPGVVRTSSRLRRGRLWLPLAAVLALVVAVAVWLSGVWSNARFSEYPMLVKTDIPTAIDVAPNGAVWFTIEFSDAIGVFQDGKIRRIRKKDQNMEALGLASDGAGGAWITDTTARAISRVSADGEVRSFLLPTPIVRLGRLALAPDGAVWFADTLMASVTRLQNGAFTPHSVGQQGATPYGIALDRSGDVWTTLQGSDELGRISSSGELTTFDVPTRNSGLGDLTTDQSGAVWFLESRANKIGRFAEGRFAEFEVPTPSAGLASLAAAPDGSVWFTELSVGKLGRIKNGQFSEFNLPRAGSRPLGVAVDTTNAVWYTDLRGWLGRLTVSR
jgi:virginiamycin B lyase